MVISSRTPEGRPSQCPICGAQTNIEFSSPASDAPCPNCGHLLWASTQILQSIVQQYGDVLNTKPGAITAKTKLKSLYGDSLETIELVMELEESNGVSIPENIAETMETIGDLVRYIESQKRGEGI